ncbi:hypothetical protein CPB86DRAFT_820658 [Serendipita vermifera]|nr:hypothetical protein CPB86DRAFT_820658 [Serendipita vermifera]
MASNAQNTQTNSNSQVAEFSSQAAQAQSGEYKLQIKPDQFQIADTGPFFKAGPELMQEQAQNATPSQTVCRHTAPGSLANFELWFEGEDPRWRAAERYNFLSTFQSTKYSDEYFTPRKLLETPCRTILIMRNAINQEAGENGTAEIEHSPEDEEMDLDDLEASQAAFAAHVASVFAVYGVDTKQ